MRLTLSLSSDFHFRHNFYYFTFPRPSLLILLSALSKYLCHPPKILPIPQIPFLHSVTRPPTSLAANPRTRADYHSAWWHLDNPPGRRIGLGAERRAYGRIDPPGRFLSWNDHPYWEAKDQLYLSGYTLPDPPSDFLFIQISLPLHLPPSSYYPQPNNIIVGWMLL